MSTGFSRLVQPPSTRAASRLRKKRNSAAAPSLWSLPVGREVKESNHSFGFAQDKLLCRVRNRYIRPSPQEALFPHPARGPSKGPRTSGSRAHPRHRNSIGRCACAVKVESEPNQTARRRKKGFAPPAPALSSSGEEKVRNDHICFGRRDFFSDPAGSRPRRPQSAKPGCIVWETYSRTRSRRPQTGY